jgi:hypothetical protein
MDREEYVRSLEGQIILAEKWVMAIQERGAGWGVHPADLVDLIVTVIKVKECFDAVKSSGNVALAKKCDQVINDVMRKISSIKQFALRKGKGEEVRRKR